MSSIDLSPVFLRELRKEVVAGKKALVGSKAIATSALALECLARVGSEGMSSRNSAAPRKQKES